MTPTEIYEKYPSIEWLKSITSMVIIGNDGKDFVYVATPNEPFDGTYTVCTVEEYKNTISNKTHNENT